MSDLSPDAVREATNPDLIGFWKNEAHIPKEHFAVLHEAARLWLASRSGPSDQEIERAMLKLVELAQDALKPTPIAVWRDRARAILVATRQGVDG